MLIFLLEAAAVVHGAESRRLSPSVALAEGAAGWC
jgi:hypothetical protein